MSATKGKDVIYIDIDDEITAIIDKVRSSEERIVALVLPKRAAAFQSIVNMKLLKRNAETAKKQLVLITSEAGLLPLAGAVGLHVAKTLQSKPEVPSAPGMHDDEETVEETATLDATPRAEKALDASRPVGEHARRAEPSVTNPLLAEDDAPIELDNETPSTPVGGKATGKSKKDKKLKIPNFNKFRLLIALGAGGLVLIILLGYVGFVVMPKAKIVVKTDSTAVSANVDVTLKTDTQTADIEAGILPATAQQTQKTATQQADATGEKDKGAKATGTIRFYNCNKDDTLAGNNITIAAGTGVTANGLTFVTTKTAVVEPSHFAGNNCLKDEKTAPIEIVAQAGGEKYNIAATSYSVAGLSSVKGDGSATSGGTTNIVKVASQTDIDNAKQKINSQNTDAIKTELQSGLKAKGLYAIDGTFSAGGAEVSTSAQVGDEASTVTVTQKTTYTMLGTKESELKKLIADRVNEEIDPDKQSILDYGLNDATFKLQNQQNANTLTTLETTVIAGSDLNISEIKKQVAGKKANDAKTIIGQYPGVTEVTVDYSPFWVSSIPKKDSKITITVEVPTVKNAR